MDTYSSSGGNIKFLLATLLTGCNQTCFNSCKWLVNSLSIIASIQWNQLPLVSKYSGWRFKAEWDNKTRYTEQKLKKKDWRVLTDDVMPAEERKYSHKNKIKDNVGSYVQKWLETKINMVQRGHNNINRVFI